MAHSSILSPGAKIGGNYEVVEVIGFGGMGVVYKIREQVGAVSRIRALKTVLPQYASDPAVAKRFREEAEKMCMLEHENIVPVLSYSEEGEFPYLIMPFIEGQTLKDYLTAQIAERHRALPLSEVMEIGLEIVRGLEVAHLFVNSETGRPQPMIHRDIKPGNIMVRVEERSGERRLRVLIMDFGIAKIVSEEDTGHSLTDVIGTVKYASPEQIRRGKDIDPRADIYSLGMVLYELYCGHHMFADRSEHMVLMQMMQREVEEVPIEFPPGTSESFQQFIRRSVATDRAQRYASVGEMREVMQRIREEDSERHLLDSQRAREQATHGRTVALEAGATDLATEAFAEADRFLSQAVAAESARDYTAGLRLFRSASASFERAAAAAGEQVRAGAARAREEIVRAVAAAASAYAEVPARLRTEAGIENLDAARTAAAAVESAFASRDFDSVRVLAEEARAALAAASSKRETCLDNAIRELTAKFTARLQEVESHYDCLLVPALHGEAKLAAEKAEQAQTANKLAEACAHLDRALAAVERLPEAIAARVAEREAALRQAEQERRSNRHAELKRSATAASQALSALAEKTAPDPEHRRFFDDLARADEQAANGDLANAVIALEKLVPELDARVATLRDRVELENAQRLEQLRLRTRDLDEQLASIPPDRKKKRRRKAALAALQKAKSALLVTDETSAAAAIADCERILGELTAEPRVARKPTAVAARARVAAGAAAAGVAALVAGYFLFSTRQTPRTSSQGAAADRVSSTAAVVAAGPASAPTQQEPRVAAPEINTSVPQNRPTPGETLETDQAAAVPAVIAASEPKTSAVEPAPPRVLEMPALAPPQTAKAPTAPPPPLTLAMAQPVNRSLRIRAGGEQRFEARVNGGKSAEITWELDGKAVGSGSAFLLKNELTAKPGNHRLAVSTGRNDMPRILASWEIEISPPPLGFIALEPSVRALERQRGETVSFRAPVKNAEAQDLSFLWEVNGQPAASGRGSAYEFEARAPGQYVVKVRAVAPWGASIDNSWNLTIKPEPAAPPAFVGAEDELRAWIQTYCQAFEHKDTTTLIELGHLSNQAEAEKLREALSMMQDLKLSCTNPSIRVAGDRATVSFDRTDRWTDPRGSKLERALPRITKTLQRANGRWVAAH